MTDEFEQIDMLYGYDDIDIPKTAKRVANFLENDKPMYERMAGVDITSLQSPSIDGMPKAPTMMNDSDRMIIKRMQARDCVAAIVNAVRHCDRECQRVLRVRYFTPYMDDTSAYTDLGYSESSYYHKWKPKSLLQFADAYMLEELHVYLTDD